VPIARGTGHMHVNEATALVPSGIHPRACLTEYLFGHHSPVVAHGLRPKGSRGPRSQQSDFLPSLVVLTRGMGLSLEGNPPLTEVGEQPLPNFLKRSRGLLPRGVTLGDGSLPLWRWI